MVRDIDHATREHLKRTGELARREGARLRESLMQNITKSCDILEADRANATELGIRSHGRIKPQNSHVSQKQMADAVSQESQYLCLPNVPARTILFPCKRSLVISMCKFIRWIYDVNLRIIPIG